MKYIIHTEGLHCGHCDAAVETELMKVDGVTDADVQAFVPNVIETQQRLLKNNYTALTADDMLAIYRSVL